MSVKNLAIFKGTYFNQGQLAKINLHGLRPIKPEAVADTFQKVSTEVLKPFKNKQEIISYFDNIGVKVDLRDFSQQDLRTFAQIRDEIIQMEKMGIKTAKPKGIVVSDWRNTEVTSQVLKEYGLDMNFPPNRRAFCGRDTGIVFINSSPEAHQFNKGKFFRKFRHEMGHQNHFAEHLRTDGSNSVLGQGGSNITFLDRQMQVLERSEKQFPAYISGVKPELINIANPINIANGQAVVTLKDGKPVPTFIDTSRMVQTMNAECRCYNKTSLSEQVAEIFEDLLKGRLFSNRTMLMYDFAGGPRIPNLKINGMPYDDYIKSLYKNHSLVDELKSSITIV